MGKKYVDFSSLDKLKAGVTEVNTSKVSEHVEPEDRDECRYCGKSCPVSKLSAHERRCSANPANESKPAAAPGPQLTDIALQALIKNYLSNYRVQHEDKKNAGAPWWGVYEECMKLAAARGWPVESWVKRMRKSTNRKVK